MIKGLISLFTSGAILNPLVLLGVVSGFFAILKLPTEKIRDLFTDVSFYALVAVVSTVYTVVFAKIYKEGGEETDWSATFGRIVGNFFKYFLAFVLSMSFVVMISF